MAIAFDAQSGTNTFANSASAKTVNLTLGGGSNRIVIAFVMQKQTAASVGVSAITFNGQAMTLAKSKNNGDTAGIYFISSIYYILEANLPGAGTYSLSVTPSAACYGGIFCLSLTDVNQGGPEATGEGSSGGTITSWANNITTLTDGAWALDANTSDDRTFTPDGGQTERADFKDGAESGHAVSTKSVATAGLTTLGQTMSSSSPNGYAQAIAAWGPPVETNNIIMF